MNNQTQGNAMGLSFGFFDGIQKLFKGFGLISKNRLWGYALMPIALTLAAAFLIKSALSFVLSAEAANLAQKLIPQLEDLGWLKTLISFSLIPFFYWLLSFLNLILYFGIGSLLWGIASGPFQEKAFFILSYQNPAAGYSSLRWALISLADTLKDLLLLALSFAGALFLRLIPLLGGIASWILLLWVSAFLIGRTQMRAASVFYCRNTTHRNTVLNGFKTSFFVGLGFLEVVASYLPGSALSIAAYFLLWAGASAGAVLAMHEAEGVQPQNPA